MGSGVGANAKYYIEDTGETLTYDKFLKEFPNEDATVEVVGFVDPQSPLPTLTGDKGFRNAKQLSIDGRRVYMTGPKGYVNPKTGQRTEEDIKNVVNNTVADIHQARYNPNSPTIVKPYGGKDVIVTFIPSAEDKTKGTFKASIDGQVISADSAYLLEDEIRTILAK